MIVGANNHSPLFNRHQIKNMGNRFNLIRRWNRVLQGRMIIRPYHLQNRPRKENPMSENQVLVLRKRNKAKTTSLIVAEKFGKRHKNVIQSIENLIKKDKRDRLKFQPIKYTDKLNREQKLYEMDRKSFSILIMGFDGEKALQWKLDFYDAFEWMEQWILSHRTMVSDPEYQVIRAEGKIYRRTQTDTIRDFVEYCIGQGSENAGKYYLAFSKMVNSILFKLPENMPKPKNLRTMLNPTQLLQVANADVIVEDAVQEGMAKGEYYKDIYKKAKERLVFFALANGGRILLAQPQMELPCFIAPTLEENEYALV